MLNNVLKNKSISKIRLFFHKDKEPYLRYKKVLGFYPITLRHYELAVQHRSLTPEGKRGQSLTNERLEYLGDAILNLIVADILYYRYPQQSEGFLTNVRARIVKRDSLNRLAVQLKIDTLVHKSKSLKAYHSQNIFGNALEAMMGAIYLDYGYNQCVRFVKKKIMQIIDLDQVASMEVNYKSRILEWCQHNKVKSNFEVLSDKTIGGNQHQFITELSINDKVICRAEGSSKKNAEQNTAKKALDIINENSEYFDELFGIINKN
ncbi:MAG: ribonuclease III [Paludibacter sp.]|nr:ribonuclease III [Paludibacter sp.]